MFEAARPKGETAEFCEHGVQGLAPAGILFPHFLLLEKENGRDGRGELIQPTNYPWEGRAHHHENHSCSLYFLLFFRLQNSGITMQVFGVLSR
jgi:hypothetical protein